jgi:hypothetical protein
MLVVAYDKSKFTSSYLVNISYRFQRMGSPFQLELQQIFHLA